MKIAHVVPALTKGGGEKVAAELANHASRAGHKITMIVGWPVDPSLLRDKLLTDVKVVCVSKKLRSRTGRYFVLILYLYHKGIDMDRNIRLCFFDLKTQRQNGVVICTVIIHRDILYVIIIH